MLASSGAAAAALAGGVFLPRLPIFDNRRTMLAVLPLADPNADAKKDPFPTEPHNQIVNLLTRLYPEGLGVIAPSSIKRYTGANRNLDQVAADLKVDYILGGRVPFQGTDRMSLRVDASELNRPVVESTFIWERVVK